MQTPADESELMTARIVIARLREMVLSDTADAEATILRTAEKMTELLGNTDPALWRNQDSREKILHDLRGLVQNIIIACSFRDIARDDFAKILGTMQETDPSF